MIDLHSHILAAVDDGSHSQEESIAILKSMEASGVKKVAATSHYPLYNNQNYPKFIHEKINLLQENARTEQLEIEIMSGAEILIEADTAELLYNKQLLTINETDYLLLETHLNFLPVYFENSVYDIKALGYQIIIAHPERYSYIQKDYKRVFRWIKEYDIKLMLNSSSLLGSHGSQAKKTAETLLKLGLYHLMGSDTHNNRHRPFSLAQGLKRAESLKPKSSQFFENNAELVVENKPLKSMAIKEEKAPLINKILSLIKKGG